MAVKHIRRRQPPADATPLADRLHPLLARVYHNRGVRDPEELSLELARLTAPTELAGIEVAAGLLADAVMTGERVLIIGDFDADGATSSALGVLALRAMGDRKSTRLNSSHVAISYAVLCLTKKIQQYALRYVL